jgi:tRNA U55 pseudouridine synthase TruB
MSEIIWVYKPIGYTPYDAIKELKHNKKITFCGRLDPMAYGLMALIIVGEDIKQIKQAITDSYKTYRFSLIVGVKTDTYDILGLPKYHNIEYNENTFNNMVINQSRIKQQEYPPFSSKTVFSAEYNKKVPLWKLSKEGKLPEVMPTRDVDIKYINILSDNEMKGSVLLHNITERINKLPENSNFRQDSILNRWNNLLDANTLYKIYHMETRLSSGTYVRTIGNNLGGTVYDICRTSVGDKCLLGADRYNKYKFLYNIKLL